MAETEFNDRREVAGMPNFNKNSLNKLPSSGTYSTNSEDDCLCVSVRLSDFLLARVDYQNQSELI